MQELVDQQLEDDQDNLGSDNHGSFLQPRLRTEFILASINVKHAIFCRSNKMM